MDTQSATEEFISSLHIQPVAKELLEQGKRHLNSLTKPRGSLGRLEEIACRLFAIRGGQIPLQVRPALMYTVAADHGVAKQGVSAYPQIVTRQMVHNFLNGGGAINVLCRENDLSLYLVDAGCKGGSFAPNPMLLERRLGDGTRDLSKEAAMDVETALKGLKIGVDLAREGAESGCQLLGCGEMGIANTTPATCLYAALLHREPKELVGPGSGLNSEGCARKCRIIEEALELHKATIAQGESCEILAALGGFEIAILTGIMLGCASERLPVLVDGFIATAAYVVGLSMDPHLADYCFLTHASAEPGFAKVLESIQTDPLLKLGMRLGEGTGAAVAYPLFCSSAAIFNDMATFAKAQVDTAKGDLCV